MAGFFLNETPIVFTRDNVTINVAITFLARLHFSAEELLLYPRRRRRRQRPRPRPHTKC